MSSILAQELKSLIYDTAIHNSEHSYKKLFNFLFVPLFRFSNGMLKNRESAEEVASDVMLKVWQNRRDLIHVDNIKVYVLTIARNQSLNVIKRNNLSKTLSLDDIRAELNPSPLSPEQILVNAQNLAKVENAIEALPTRCKLVFKLIKEEGMTYREVAEILNISPKTVDAHLVASMKKLSQSVVMSQKRA